jgi:hypothetical protein
LPNGTTALKELLRMSWRSLILMAVADAQPFFSRAFLAELESSSPFRFDFLRARNEKLAGRQALYATLFDAFMEAGSDDRSDLPMPRESFSEEDLHPAGDIRCLSSSFA